MPELPEVETVARQLNLALPGRVIRRFILHDKKLASMEGPAATLVDARMGPVFRSGKRVILELERVAPLSPVWLAVHLRMTGRLVLEEADERPIDRLHARATLELDRGLLRFLDTRRFGTLDLLTRAEDLPPPGLDPFDKACTAARLAALGRGSGTPIKVWLLEQHHICGLGNIYACEILHAAGLAPGRETGSLDPSEWRRLRHEMRRILTRAIALCGTTFSDFQDSRGLEGGFGRWLTVYGREGEICAACGGRVIRETIRQRGTFWCPGCQH